MTTAKAVATNVATVAWAHTIRNCSSATLSRISGSSFTPTRFAIVCITRISVALQENRKFGRACDPLAATVLPESLDLLNDRQVAPRLCEFAEHFDESRVLVRA